MAGLGLTYGQWFHQAMKTGRVYKVPESKPKSVIGTRSYKQILNKELDLDSYQN